MEEQLTMDDLFELLDKFRSARVDLGHERCGDIGRTVEYKDGKVAIYTYRNNPNVVHMWSVKGNSESSMGEFEINKENYKHIIIGAFEKNARGLCRCCYCGKWVAESKVERYAPAGLACDNPECRKKGREDERDFFSYPLD